MDNADTLRLYDVKLDRFRAATQADIDRLVATATAYGQLRLAAAKVHATLHENLGQIDDGADG